MTSAPRFLSELRFGACFVYSPRGSSELSIRSRRILDAIKYDTPGTIARAVEIIARDLSVSGLGDILGSGATLAPAPRSAPLKDALALWPARRISEALVSAGPC